MKAPNGQSLVDPPAYPSQAEHVAERPVDGELVLYDGDRQRVHVLNATAAYVWQLCDGQHDCPAIAEALASYYPESRQAIEEDVAVTLRLFVAEGLLTA